MLRTVKRQIRQHFLSGSNRFLCEYRFPKVWFPFPESALREKSYRDRMKQEFS